MSGQASDNGGEPQSLIQQRIIERARKREELRANKFANSTQRSDDAVSSSDSCIVQNGPTVMLAVNVFFGLVAIVSIAVWIWAASGPYGALSSTGPAIAAIIFGPVVLCTSCFGECSFRYNNKCGIIIYLFLVFVALVLYITGGSIFAFDDGVYNEQFSDWWCEFPEEAARAQREHDCCGYECPWDRPAEGGCPAPQGALAANASWLCTGPGPGGATSPSDAKALCESAPDGTFQLPGCKEAGLSELEDRYFGLFFAGLAVGLAMLVALCVGCTLLCRRKGDVTDPTYERHGMEGAHTWNQPSADEWADSELKAGDLEMAQGTTNGGAERAYRVQAAAAAAGGDSASSPHHRQEQAWSSPTGKGQGEAQGAEYGSPSERPKVGGQGQGEGKSDG